MDDLHPQLTPKLLNMMTKMLACQQKQMRKYEQKIDDFIRRQFSSATKPFCVSSLDSSEKMQLQLSDFPKFTESISGEETIQYLGFPK